MNYSNKTGSVGFVSPLFPFLLPYRIIKVDEATGEPVRDPDSGLCVMCEPGEQGEMVSPISKQVRLHNLILTVFMT